MTAKTTTAKTTTAKTMTAKTMTAKNKSIETLNNVVRTVSTRQLYDNFLASLSDTSWFSGDPFTQDSVDILNCLITSDVDLIRKAFSDGYSMMLAPDVIGDFDCAASEADIELRITGRDGRVITVLVNDEISY